MVEDAANAEDAATLQTLKTLDSLESKIQNLKNAWQGFYANLGLEEVFKAALDFLTRIINRFNEMPKLFGKIPVAAVSIISSAINSVKIIFTGLFTWLIKRYNEVSENAKNSLIRAHREARKTIQNEEQNSQNNNGKVELSAKGKRAQAAGIISTVSSLAVTGAQMLPSTSINSINARGNITAGAGLLGAVAGGVRLFSGDIAGGIMSLVSGLSSLYTGIQDIIHAEDTYIKSLGEQIQKQEQAALVAKNEAKTMAQSVKKLEQLRDAQYTSNEAYEEYIEYQNTLADQYPQIVAAYDAQGNAVIDYASTYNVLAKSIANASKEERELARLSLEKAKAELSKTLKILDVIGIDGTLRVGAPQQTGVQYTFYDNETKAYKQPEVAQLGSKTFSKIIDRWMSTGIVNAKGELNWAALFAESGEANKQSSADAIYDLLKWQGVLSDNNFLQLGNFESQSAFEKYFSDIYNGKATEDVIDYFYHLISLYLEKASESANINKQLAELEQSSAETNEKITQYVQTLIANQDSIINGYQTAISNLLGKDGTFSNLIISGAKSFYTDDSWAGLSDDEKESLLQASTNNWIYIYKQLGEQGYNDLINILSHPEKYASVQDMTAAIDATESLEGIWQLEGIGASLGNYWNTVLQVQIDQMRKQFLDSLKRAATKAGQYDSETDTFAEESIFKALENAYTNINAELYPFFSKLIGRYAEATSEYDRNAIATLIEGLVADPDLINTDEFFNLTKDIDIYDRTAMLELAESLEDSTLKGIIQTYAKTLSFNINTLVNDLEQALQENVESATKIIEAQGKGIKDITEARAQLESLNTLLDKNYSFNEIYEYSDALQGYVYNAQILKELLKKKASAQSEELTDFNKFFETELKEGSEFLNTIPLDKTQIEAILNSENNLTDWQRRFLTDYIQSESDDIVEFAKNYNEMYYKRIQEETVASRQLIAAQMLDSLEIDKILAGEAASIKNLDDNLAMYLSWRYGEDSPLLAPYKAAVKALATGNIDASNFDTAVEFLTSIGVDNPIDEVLAVQVREVNKRSELLQKLLKGSTGDVIRLTDAEMRILGVTNANLAVNSQEFVNSIRQLIQSASDALHSGQMTLEEYNKQVLQVATFGNSDYNTAIPDAISGLEKITVDSLASFATALGVELKPDFDVGELKGLQKIGNDWVVNNFEALAQSIAAQSTGIIELDMGDSRIQAAIASLSDNLVEVISSFITLAGNGVKGTLNAVDTVNLTEYAKSLKYDGKLDFTQTAEGMKLTADSAAQLYDWLRKTQGLQGQLAFQEYAKSLKDSSSTYKDIFATEREIARLRKEENKDLSAQLNLARQIALIQMSETDSYSFMDRKLPNDFAGPTNFWNAVDDMYSALGDAASTGYLSTQDFYNMIMAANDMAAATGKQITLFGETLNGDATIAAQLIEKGFDALTHVDGKGLMVSLEGMGIDFKAGAQAMGGNFEEGMQEFAKSQVTLLDGLISFVKTIVAMEDIGDLAGEDGILDFTDIYGSLEADTNLQDFVTKLQEDEELWQQLSDIYIDSRPLTEILTSAELTEEDARKLTQVLNAIWQMAKSDDWDITDLSTIMASLAEGFNGLDGEVEIGRAGLVFKGGFALQYEYDPDTNEKVWLIGDKKYTDQSEAMLAAFAQDAGDAYDANTKTFTIGGFTAKVDVENGEITYNGHKSLVDALKEQYVAEAGYDGILDFNQYLANLGLALDANGEIILKADDVQEAIDPQITAVKANTTATEENTKALNQFGEAMFNTDGGGWSKPSIKTSTETTTTKPGRGRPEAPFDLGISNEEYARLRAQEQSAIETAAEAIETAIEGIQQISYEPLHTGSLGPSIGRQLAEAKAQTWEAPETTSPFVSIINNFISEAKDKITNVIDNLQDIVEQAKLHQEQVAREASVNGETDEYVHVPDTLEEEFTQQIQSFADVVGVAYEDIYNAWQSAKAEDSSLAWEDFIAQYQQTLSETGTSLSEVTTNGEDAAEALGTVNTTGKIAAPALRGIATPATRAASGLSGVAGAIGTAIESLHSFDTRLRGITGAIVGSGAKPTGSLTSNLSPNLHTKATGSFGNAFATGTLMGELGPELWVSHGHYYVAGQNGAEFVNLPDDAIVFNHLQTQRLLGSGSAGGHGKPVTNERKATSLATGNVNGGPAKASASNTLNQLLQLRAMWQAIAEMPVSDLGKKAGSGGGGGGGGSAEDMKAFVGELQRWFNLTQEIAKLEKDITREQKQRAVYISDQIAHGKEIYESYRKEFNALKDEINATQTLADLQQSWYEKRRKDFESSGLSKIFTFDENGVMKYTGNDQPQSGEGLDILATLYQTDSKGVSVFENAGAQMDYLKSVLGVGDDFFKQLSDGSGNQISAESSSEEFLQAWDDLVNSWKDEMTELYDEYNENQMKVYELQSSQNEIIQSIIDNQLSLEQRVLTALIDKAQKAIDDLQKSRDAMADANERYINGLNDSLQKQRDMYDRNESANELNKLQRQLAILQRSGGSASQIRSLQQQINDQMQDSYFTTQQDQINAIKEAADAQIDRLDRQIELMTETLAYQKENGLFWSQVYEIMQTWDPTAIQQFIVENTKAMQGLSTLDLSQQMKDVANEIGIYREDLQESIAAGTQKGLSQEHYTEPEHVTMNNSAIASNGTAAITTTTTTAPKSGGGGSGGGSGTGIGNKTGNIDNSVNTTTKNPTLTCVYYKDGRKDSSKQYSVNVGSTINPAAYVKSISGYNCTSMEPSQAIKVKEGTNYLFRYYYTKKQQTTTTSKINKNLPELPLLKTKEYASGGLVDYTGPAQVHGSKTRPESFFDAASTAILRDDVLGSINVLDSLLADVSTVGTSHLNLGSNESLSIANPIININVDKIANDYDAKHAGQLAFDEMVKIARQSGNRSLSRR